MKKKIINFIKLNNLTFERGRRNTDSTILSGYALHLGIIDVEELIAITEEYRKTLPKDSNHFFDYIDELKRVFVYACDNNYGEFWNTEGAKSSYTF